MDHIFLKINITWNNILGVMKLETENPLINTLHRMYSYFWVITGFIFTLSQFGEFIHYEETNILTFIDNIRLSSLMIYSFFKYYYVTAAALTKLANHIRSKEKDMLNSGDQNIIDIFWENQRVHTRITKFFLVFSYWTLIVFYIYPAYYSMTAPDDKLYDRTGNKTIYLPRPTPFSGVFPFDKNRYYKTTFVFQMIAGWFTCSFTIMPDAYFWGLMAFGTTQIKVLKYKLRYFAELSVKDIRFNDLPNTEVIAYNYLQDCIKEHRIIIQYIEDLDNTFKYMMLIDSILSTVQIALIGLGCLLTGMSLRQMDALQYFAWNITQLFFFYYNANEVLLAGLSLPGAIWESDWYNCSERIKKILFFIMKRSGIPLVLNVGPFYSMSIATMLSILKTAMSYFAVMRQQFSKH